MALKLKRIIVPATVVLLAAVQSFGVDALRSMRFHSDRDDALRLQKATGAADTSDLIFVPVADTAELLRQDSLRRLRHLKDSLVLDSLKAQVDSFGREYMDSADLALLDSLQAMFTINPRDTIRIPDSLEFKDPFKFKYYIALRDTATRRLVRDSLLQAADTLELMRFDSLYVKDSTETAQWLFEQKWAKMSRRERKKYLYEQALPAKIARMDSILHRKDSIKARKDSIVAATPRILETYVLPDSLQYRRIIHWTHDRYVNDLQLKPFDTTYNYRFHDSPFLKEDIDASWLGISGSALQKYNYFKRDEEKNVLFYTPYRSWSHSPEDLLQYNTKNPYTELAYWGTLLAGTQTEESNIKVLTTQNITPALNLTLEYSRFGANGILQNEKTNNRTAVIGTNYLGKNYLMHAGYIHNKVIRSENGGAIDQDPVTGINWIRDTTLKDPREIDIRLKSASNTYRRNTVFLDQSWRFPMSAFRKIGHRKEIKAEKLYRDSLMLSGDSLAIQEYLEWEKAVAAEADTLDKNVTSAFIGHSSEFSSFSKLYSDNISGSDKVGREFYNNNFFLHPTTSSDSMRVIRLENRVYLRLQPWKSDGIVSKIDVGIGDKFLNYFAFNDLSYLGKKSSRSFNSLYVYAGAQGQYKKYLNWHANGRYNFAGHELNDFNVSAGLDLSFYPFRRDKSSPLTLSARFETDLSEADWYQQHYLSNHYRWDNDFGKISTTKVEASLNIPRWDLKADFGYALLNNNTYYDTLGIVRQNTKPMSVFSAGLTKNFTIWKFHLENTALLQFSSDPEVMPLPLFSARFRYYFQFDVVKKVMQMQVGLNVWYNTAWYSPAWNPALGVFQNQKDIRIGNCPYADAFINVQWKRACIFIKVVNVNEGWPCRQTDYFSTAHYIKTTRAVKFGIFWPFYVQPANKNSSATSGGPSGGRSAGRSGLRNN